MNMLILEGCLLLGLLASFAIVAVLVRHVEAPSFDASQAGRAADRQVATRGALPDAV